LSEASEERFRRMLEAYEQSLGTYGAAGPSQMKTGDD
jgi:hypothetical protein